MFDSGLINVADDLEILISRQTNDLDGIGSINLGVRSVRPADRAHL